MGFGGGSTYTALLAFWGVDYRIVPVISLLCNIIVVTGGCARFWTAGLIDWQRFLPLLLISAPLAFLGGQLPVEEAFFYLLLGGALMLSAIALFVPTERLPSKKLPQPLLMGLSGGVGLLAGLSGIGGGIFMAPLLHLARWSEPRKIAAFASVYILINSIAGLAGQLSKSGVVTFYGIAESYWPLMLAVLIGGQAGSYLGLRLITPVYLRWITGALVAYVALRLLIRGIIPS